MNEVFIPDMVLPPDFDRQLNAILGQDIPEFPWAKFIRNGLIDGAVVTSAALWAGGLIAAGGFVGILGWGLAILGGLSALTLLFRLMGLGMWAWGASQLRKL